MTERVTLIFKPPREGSRISSPGLPPELLERSRGRVRLVAILALIGFGSDVLIAFLGWIVSLVTGQPFEGLAEGLHALTGNGIAILASLGIIVATRSRRLRPETVLNLGLVFEVVLCAIISIYNPWTTYRDTGFVPRLTWASPVIIMFPLIIPTRPSKTLITAFLAAATSPIALLFLNATGRIVADGEALASNIVSPLIAVAFAFMASRVVYQLGLEVSAARQLGSYRLEERLGAGGMGEVWRARHRLLARPAAVKLIRPEFLAANSDERALALERFEREAQATALMHSPHTIEVYDFGVSSDGVFYYVMELLEGFTAETLVERFGPLDAARTVHLLRQVCHSLAEAHAGGLIHRDIKPANIFVCRYGRELDFVKVLDFGLVKSAGSGTAGDAKLTADGVAAGTPAAMSPEQILGQPVDGRSDLYGVGCLAYWLLTGRLVFEGRTPLETLTHHLHTTPAPPSALGELPVPTALDAVVLSCLAKDPAGRPQTADALSEALAAIDTGPPWTPERAARWWDVHGPAQASS